MFSFLNKSIYQTLNISYIIRRKCVSFSFLLLFFPLPFLHIHPYPVKEESISHKIRYNNTNRSSDKDVSSVVIVTDITECMESIAQSDCSIVKLWTDMLYAKLNRVTSIVHILTKFCQNPTNITYIYHSETIRL